MARVIGGGEPPSGNSRLGDRFEFEVQEALRMGLPAEDYLVVPNVLLINEQPGDRRSQRYGRDGRHQRRSINPSKADSDRELDFIVAGPSGVVVIEAKAWKDVRGPFLGDWERRRSFGSKVSQSDRVRGPFHPTSMKKNLERVRSRVNQVSEFRGYGTAKGIVVLPKGSNIDVTDREDRQTRQEGRMYLVTLDQLTSTILNLRPPQREDGSHRPPLTREGVERLAKLFEPGAPSPSPHVGAYTKQGECLDRCQAVNGVRFACWEIVHNEMGWIREGKAYDLSALNESERNLFNEQVKRHAAVAHSIEHANVHGILDMFLHGEELWVVQKRVPGDRLHRLMEAKKERELPIQQVLKDIAAGLEALHRARFVRRELSPMSIVITQERRAVLTDFELAKSLDGGPTVAVDELWLQNPYVAPEVLADAHHGQPTADIYSWGSIAYALLTGTEYDRNPNPKEALVKSNSDTRLTELVASCLQLFPQRRPQTAAALLAEMG